MLRHLSLLSLVTLAGCPDRTIDKVDTDQTGAYTKDIPVSADIDILFVIDNSRSTKEKQDLFGENFKNFVTALDTKFPQGRPNLHIGVVSTSIDLGTSVGGSPSCHPSAGENGILQNTRQASCDPTSGPPTARYIEDIALPNGDRRVNYPGTLDKALPCIAQIGDNGCGFETPLEAIKRALDGRHPENAGFLRKGAYLAVVILTDEDDCSAKDPASFFALPTTAVGADDFRCTSAAYQCDQPMSITAGGNYTNCRLRTDASAKLADPAEYAQFVASLKPPGHAIVALIAGDPKLDISTGPLQIDASSQTQPLALLPSCNAMINGKTALGRPANRLNAFMSSFGEHGLFRTVCQADYSQALADIGQTLFNLISPCLEGDLDTRDIDPNNPGTQLDCAVSDIGDPDTGHEVESQVARCAMTDANTPDPAGARPCYWIKPNPGACTTETGLEIHVERSSSAATGTELRVSCATAP